MSDETESSHPNQEPLPNKAKRGCGCLHLLVTGVLLLFAVGLIIPQFGAVQDSARLMQACNNCRAILLTLKCYADDHGGRYPEGKTANDAFRDLFKADLMDDERAFTALNSPYQPDNNIGEAPNYSETLEPGENHWAMTRGLTSRSDKDAPLVFENPAKATWPPFWNADVKGRPEPGRTWKSGKIVIGRNDGSVAAEKLASNHGPAATLEKGADGKDLFERIGPHEIMDVAR